jgi:hypothetical protein
VSEPKAGYRCVAVTLEGFIQQLSVSYVARGYWFYVTGRVPERKTPAEVDRALVDKYQVALSPQARARRKRAGGANVHYLRFQAYWVLLATHGTHRFFVEHEGHVRDVRRRPIRFGGYSVSFRGGHVQVRIDREAYLELKAYYLEEAKRQSASWLEREFSRWPFEMYAPVRRQLLMIYREVCRERRRAGLNVPRKDPIWFRRRQVLVFGPVVAGANDGRSYSSEDPGEPPVVKVRAV